MSYPRALFQGGNVNDSNQAPITFLVPGRRSVGAAATRGGAPATGPLPGGLLAGRVKESVRVGANRDAGVVRVSAVPGQDVVVLAIDGGPELTLHPETARDLLLAQTGGQPVRGAQVSGEGTQAHEVQVPSTLQWRGLEPAVAAVRGGVRDFVGGVVLKAVDVVTDIVKDKAAEKVAGGLARRVDGQVSPGVYKLNATSLLPLKQFTKIDEVPPRPDNGAVLVFVHGTFSNTSTAFQKLWRES